MADVRNGPKVFTIVPVLSGGTSLPEVNKIAVLQKDATAAAWTELTDAQRDNLEYFDVVEIRPVPKTVESIPVEFDTNGCLKVPEMPSGLKRRHNNHAANEEYLQEIGKHGRDAQTILDRIPTINIEEKLDPATSLEEREVFRKLQQLNAEVVVRLLMMRRLATNALIGR